MIMVFISVFISGPNKEFALSIERIKGKFSFHIHLMVVAEVTAIGCGLLGLVTEDAGLPNTHSEKPRPSKRCISNGHFVEYTVEMQSVLRNAIIEDCKLSKCGVNN